MTKEELIMLIQQEWRGDNKNPDDRKRDITEKLITDFINQQSEEMAVRFAEWCFETEYEGRSLSMTTKELYALFKQGDEKG